MKFIAILLLCATGIAAQSSTTSPIETSPDPDDKTTPSANSLECLLCYAVMEEVDSIITDPSNEEEVADALKVVCNNFPDYQIECEVMIEQYTDDIIELIVNQYLLPHEVCPALGLCPPVEY